MTQGLHVSCKKCIRKCNVKCIVCNVLLLKELLNSQLELFYVKI